MTEQMPNKIENQCLFVHFGDLYFPVSVILGPIQANDGWGKGEYPYKVKPVLDDIVCTDNWEGYISSFRLNHNGRLTLLSYHYPYTTKPPTDVNEILEGDFFLIMKSNFYSPRTYIPFWDGKIVADNSQWINEKDLKLEPKNMSEDHEHISIEELNIFTPDKNQRMVSLSSLIIELNYPSSLEKAINQLDKYINEAPVSWPEAVEISKNMRKWRHYKVKAGELINILAKQILDRAKIPRNIKKKSKLLEVILEHYSDTDVYQETKGLIGK